MKSRNAVTGTTGRCRAGWPTFVLAALLLACSHGDDTRVEGPSSARSTVIICVDTLRTDHLGAYGYRRDTSPNIDQLAAAGTRFELAVSQSNWTVPAVASLMTSLYPSQHGAGLAGEVRNLGESKVQQMRSDVVPFARKLQQDGLRTGLFSANPYLFGRFKLGFDEAEVGRVDAAELTDKAIGFLDRLGDERFLIYLQYMDLHQPIEPPQRYSDLFRSDVAGEKSKEHSGWAFGRLENASEPAFQEFKAHKIDLYDGAIRFVDDEIGRFLEALEARGLGESTLVVLTADHGEEFWDHADFGRELGADPRGIWGIGHGHSMFQELVRVPLIFRGPGVAEGRESSCPVQLVDVVPTLFDRLALEPMDGIRGRSLADEIDPRGNTGDCAPRSLLSESPAYGPAAVSVILDRYKLIRRADGRRFLYDLERDPDEQVDLATQYPEVVGRLESVMDEELAGAGDWGEDVEMRFDEETREQLEALGYLN